MNKTVIKIGVVSDVVCPWCYIGKRRLEKAIANLNDKYEFDVAYYPFELNPEMPLNGVDQKKYLSDKFGGDEAYTQMTDRVTRIAKEEGIDFNFDKQKISPNTRNAHRLLLLSREDNKQIELAEALFKAYFTEGIDLSSNENLVAIATAVGLDEDKIRLFLSSTTGLTEVAAAENELNQIGISGVPFYIINDKYGISGAQPESVFIEALENIGKEVTAGISCDVDDKKC